MIAQQRFIDRLQLSGYPTSIDEAVRLDPGHVRLPLKHGVGIPASPVCAVGDEVRVGQVVADVEFGKVGAPVHASIDGIVTEVGDSFITIKQEGKP